MSALRTYDSKEAAKLLLALAEAKGIAMNYTKVQKLLYIIYGYYASQFDYFIFNETPKAWPYGPVFPRARKIDPTTHFTLEELGDISKDQTLVEIFNRVLDSYGGYPATQLSNWSHKDGGPWYKTTKLPGFDWNREIPEEFIKEYFATFKVFDESEK